MSTFTPKELHDIYLADKYELSGPLTKTDLSATKDIERQVRKMRMQLGIETRGKRLKGKGGRPHK